MSTLKQERFKQEIKARYHIAQNENDCGHIRPQLTGPADQQQEDSQSQRNLHQKIPYIQSSLCA